MNTYKSPSGSPIIGTLETLSGRANVIGINTDGTPEYSGDTEVFWDDQRTILREGKMIFLDEDGAEWTFDQLVIDEEDVPE